MRGLEGFNTSSQVTVFGTVERTAGGKCRTSHQKAKTMFDDDTPTDHGGGKHGDTRRAVLKCLAASGLAGVGLTGTATADRGTTGGNLLTVETEFGTGEPQIGVPFHISDDFAEDFEFPASCHASESQLKSYKTGIILFYPGRDLIQIAAVRNDKKHLDMDRGTFYEFTSSQECKSGPGVWRGSFKPAREGEVQRPSAAER